MPNETEQQPAYTTFGPLLERARNGDAQAFAALIKEFEPFVYRSSLNVCRDPARAEATMQDTLINIFRKLHQYEGDAQFTTWLYTIILNNCMMNRRRRKLDEVTISLDAPAATDATPQPEPAGGDTPVEQLLQLELRGLLEKATATLPDEYQRVFVLRDIEQKSGEETAQELGLSLPAVKSRLHRARKMMRQQLEEYVHNPA